MKTRNQFIVDHSLVQICLDRVTKLDELQLRGLLNRYVLISACLIQSGIESGGRWRHSLEGRQLIKVRTATLRSLKLFAETGTLVMPEKEKKEIKIGLGESN